MTSAEFQTVNLPNEAVTEFQELYYKHFGERLSYEDAAIKAIDFMTFYKLVHQPLKKDWIKQHDKKQKNK